MSEVTEPDRLGRYPITGHLGAGGMNPRAFTARFERGYVRHLTRRFKAAIRDYDAVIRVQPNHWQAWGNRGLSYLRLGARRESIESLRRAIELAPEARKPALKRDLKKAEALD